MFVALIGLFSADIQYNPRTRLPLTMKQFLRCFNDGMSIPPDLSPPLTGMILAGGKARRMGGQDKGLISYQGRPLIAHVLERLEPQVHTVLINANRSHDQYAQFGHPVITDAEDGFLGPLAGILAGLRAAQTELLLCVPCDSPGISPNLAEKLAFPFTQEGARITVASCAGRLQPVFAMLHTGLSEALDDFLRHGGRKIDEFYGAQGFEEIPFENPDEFRNINTRGELTL